MRHAGREFGWVLLVALIALFGLQGVAYTQQSAEQTSSYLPVDIKESFATILARMQAAKAEVMKRQMDLLNERYDLSDHPAQGVTMSRGKPIQEGVRVKLPEGVSWDKLAAMMPEEIREKDMFPAGFFPCLIRITRKAAWCFRSSKSTRSRSKKAAI
jgi:hypothetical protein